MADCLIPRFPLAENLILPLFETGKDQPRAYTCTHAHLHIYMFIEMYTRVFLECSK
jgi:hypothetical protein